MFLLNSLANKKFDKKCVGLYRDEGLAVFRNINGHHADKTRKEFYQLFEANGLSLEIQCNLKTVNYLDITLNLNTGTYKPYRKPNDEILYINAKSNHTANILKQLPISIETRLSNLSNNPEIFHEASMHYKNILNQSGYDYKLQYQPTNNENDNRSKSPKNRKRNIIWFNPPFSKNVSNNIGKDFLLLIQKHFPNEQISNIKSIINMHNKEVISEKETEAPKCNCISKPDCPRSNQCQITNIIYKAEITSNLRNYHEKIYYGTSERTFKQRYGNHKKSFNHEKHRTDTELSKEYWRLKKLKAKPQVQFHILKRYRPTKEQVFVIYV